MVERLGIAQIWSLPLPSGFVLVNGQSAIVVYVAGFSCVAIWPVTVVSKPIWLVLTFWRKSLRGQRMPQCDESQKTKGCNFRCSPHLFHGAQEKTRTSTVVKPPAPEAGASTNFATWATLHSIAPSEGLPKCRADFWT